MRKLLSKVFLLAVLAVIFLTATGAAAEIGTGTVTGNSVNLRSGPSTSTVAITQLMSGAQVKVLAKQDDNWYKVEWRGYTGYISASYLAFVPYEYQDLTGKTGVIADTSVNFRSGPSTSDDVITVLEPGSELELIEQYGDWCKAVYDGQEGYVHAAYVTVNGWPLVNPRGVVTGNLVNIRSGPSTGNTILTQVSAGAILDLVSLDGDWYAINYNGLSGYIYASYVRVWKGDGDSVLGQSIVDEALQFIGTPYVYGGNGPKSFDCSGFTSYIYKMFGYSLNRTASGQWTGNGTYVTKSELQPGDLVAFNDPSISKGKAASHVGIYIGDGQFVHASSSKGVVISDLDGAYYCSYFIGGKRVI